MVKDMTKWNLQQSAKKECVVKGDSVDNQKQIWKIVSSRGAGRLGSTGTGG